MSNKHEKIEKNVGLMIVLVAAAVSFGGLAEIVPLMYQAETITPLPGVNTLKPGSASKPFFGVEPVVLRDSRSRCACVASCSA